MVRNYFPAISSIILLLGSFATISIAKPGQASAKCDPVGRVLSDGDLLHPTGSQPCEGALLNSHNTVDVWCYRTRQTVHVSGFKANIGLICRQARSAPLVRYEACSFDNPSRCPKTFKGPISSGASIVMLGPYGTNLIERRPNLSWESFPGTNSYRVEVRGPGVRWARVLKGSSLAYPADEPALEYGNTYKIQVFAEKGDLILANGSTIVNLLPQKEVNVVEALVQRFKKLGIPPDEIVRDLDSVYLSQGLLNATITSLEARVRARSHNPEVHRILGDRYLEAGLPRRAKSEYEVAAKYAEERSDLAELQKDQANLQNLQHQSQLPTRTNGAQ